MARKKKTNTSWQTTVAGVLGGLLVPLSDIAGQMYQNGQLTWPNFRSVMIGAAIAAVGTLAKSASVTGLPQK